MKEIVVVSGKGGTGKTSITAAFAVLAKKHVLVDCDVDAADLHLVLSPTVIETNEFSGGKIARIIEDNCCGCGNCDDVCRFEAIASDKRVVNGNEVLQWHVDPLSCEGCGVCVLACPCEAIEFENAMNGYWFKSETRVGPFIHARLGIAEENSGKLVSIIKQEARKQAESLGYELILVDGPPGIGCPAISSLSGASLAVIVTEPTIAGVHDLERVIKLTAHFKIPAGVIINKSDINPYYADEIKRTAQDNGIAFFGEIMYNKSFIESQLVEKSIVEYQEGPVTDALRDIWDRIMEELTIKIG
jgi:MinD superfamily P-loop ATPase